MRRATDSERVHQSAESYIAIWEKKVGDSPILLGNKAVCDELLEGSVKLSSIEDKIKLLQAVYNRKKDLIQKKLWHETTSEVFYLGLFLSAMGTPETIIATVEDFKDLIKNDIQLFNALVKTHPEKFFQLMLSEPHPYEIKLTILDVEAEKIIKGQILKLMFARKKADSTEDKTGEVSLDIDSPVVPTITTPSHLLFLKVSSALISKMSLKSFAHSNELTVDDVFTETAIFQKIKEVKEEIGRQLRVYNKNGQIEDRTQFEEKIYKEALLRLAEGVEENVNFSKTEDNKLKAVWEHIVSEFKLKKIISKANQTHPSTKSSSI